MIRHRGDGWPPVTALLLVGATLAGPLWAQTHRDSLVTTAAAEFETARRVQLLVTALNPALGPPDDAWTTAVQLLAQTLVGEGEGTVAAAWLRWAIRLAPDFRPDTVQLLPQVIAAYRAAQAVVERTRSPHDSLATTTWLWPDRVGTAAPGRLRVSATPSAALASMIVLGVGPLRPGEAFQLPPGSHTVKAVAPGYDSVAVTREALPGVTTVLTLHLPPASTLHPLAAETEPGAPPPDLQRRRGGGFPWVIMGLGAVAAGAVVALLAGGDGGGGSGGGGTGGITITFPNP